MEGQQQNTWSAYLKTVPRAGDRCGEDQTPHGAWDTKGHLRVTKAMRTEFRMVNTWEAWLALCAKVHSDLFMLGYTRGLYKYSKSLNYGAEDTGQQG